VILRTLHKDHTKKEWAVQHELGSMDKTEIEMFRAEIDGLDKKVREKLANLAQMSQDLIQLVYRIVYSCLGLSADTAVGI
jgi:hypothetical protein